MFFWEVYSLFIIMTEAIIIVCLFKKMTGTNLIEKITLPLNVRVRCYNKLVKSINKTFNSF